VPAMSLAIPHSKQMLTLSIGLWEQSSQGKLKMRMKIEKK